MAELDKRAARLGAAIAAARARLTGREDFADDEIGDLLAAINDDFEGAAAPDAAALERLEARLAALEGRLKPPG